VSLQSREFREAVQFEVEKEKERAQETIQQHKDKWVTCWSHDMYVRTCIVPLTGAGWLSRSSNTSTLKTSSVQLSA